MLGIEGEGEVGCKGGRDMRVGSFSCGGNVTTGEGFGSAASGFAGLSIEGPASRELSGGVTGASAPPGFSTLGTIVSPVVEAAVF